MTSRIPKLFNFDRMLLSLILLLWLHPLLASEISVCSSDIYIKEDQGNPSPTKFFSESFDELESSVRYFCARHLIPPDECDRIKSYHSARCFPGSTIGSDAFTDTNQRNDGVNTDTSITEHFVDDGRSIRRKLVVDYGLAVGPILSVTHLQETKNMQSYEGESKEQTVVRFCGMLKLDNQQCKQVEGAYFSLLRPIGNGDEATIGESVLPKETEEPSPQPTSVKRANAATLHFYEALYEIYARYGKYILVVLGMVVFLFTERR